MTSVFIAGATGYTGRNVVAACLAKELETIAHVRPDSPALERWTEALTSQGATVETSPWTPEAMAAAMQRYRPDHVFALLGTTARRGRAEGSTYESVDYGLTAMLLGAAASLDPHPCFVYLSAAGSGGAALNAYMKARVQVERAIAAVGIPHLIARPSFITGSDRDEDRPAERVGANVVDGALEILAALGLRGPRLRWGSITGPQLGEALVRLALEGRRGIVDAAELQEAARASAARR